MRFLKNIFTITIPTFVIFLCLLELFFRFVIPASESPRGYFDEKEKIYCLSNEKQNGLYTEGRFAEIKAKWHINNTHWNSTIDYVPCIDKKLIAVIGDSFIESFQVNSDENYPSLLRNELRPNFEVFSFGKSGAPLSEYLNVSRYVNKHFNPDILIFNIVHNDFDESIHELYPENYFFLQVSIDEKDSIGETLPRPNYAFVQYKPLKGLIYRSALFRYLYVNLHLAGIRQKIKANNVFSKSQFEANIQLVYVKDKERLINLSTDYLVKTIKKENFNKRIIFVFDAPRDAIYNSTLNRSNVMWLHDMLKNMCKKYGIEYIDLTSFMQHDYLINRKKFNSELDGHWNEYGHRYVANILINYLKNSDTHGIY